ncbi:sortase [Rhabdothermincola sp.]|uniref:sortase n=1 Tax=Rhabdothermincola sp. TaxID=2820405 RepID=UPI002FE2F781
MTVLVSGPVDRPRTSDRQVVVEPPDRPQQSQEPAGRSRRRVGTKALVAMWAGALLVSLALVIFAVEPVFQARRQATLLESYRARIERAANESSSLYGVTVPTKAPELGAPIAILEIGDLQVQQVVVEGATASQTRAGPGHVAGTAAPGQPGNSVVVGRRAGFGGPFGRLHELEPGARILVTTTQGQAVYTVTSVGERSVRSVPEADTSSPVNAAATGGGIGTDAGVDDGTVTVDELYGPTDDDRLTLVTSASSLPWNSDRATIVIAQLEGLPFPPTPQNGRVDSATGLAGDAAAVPSVLLCLLALASSGVVTVLLYRRASLRAAYLLTAPVLMVLLVVTAEQLARLLPAWV